MCDEVFNSRFYAHAVETRNFLRNTSRNLMKKGKHASKPEVHCNCTGERMQD